MANLNPAAALFALPLFACVTTTGEAPGSTRAGLASNTSTTAYGTFEVELGYELDPSDTQTVPARLKYGSSEITEVFLDVPLYKKVDIDGEAKDGEGIGDAAVGVRHRFWEGARGTTGALQGAVKFPTGSKSEGTGNGKMDLFAAGIVSQEFENVALTGFLELGVVGNALDNDTDVQRVVALAWASQLSNGVSAIGEVSRRFLDGDAPAMLMLGGAYQLSSVTLLDFGVSFGLNGDAGDEVFFVGLTTNLGILGPQGPRPYTQGDSSY